MKEYAVVEKESESSLAQRITLITNDYVCALKEMQSCKNCRRFAEIYEREVSDWQKVDITKKQDK